VHSDFIKPLQSLFQVGYFSFNSNKTLYLRSNAAELTHYLHQKHPLTSPPVPNWEQLALTQQPVATYHFAGPGGNGLPPPLYSPYPNATQTYHNRTSYNDPVEAWEKAQLCEPLKVWQKNENTTAEVGAAAMFSEFVEVFDTSDLYHCKEMGLSPVKCFMYTFTGNANFNCRIDQVHKCKYPSAYETMRHISQSWPVGEGRTTLQNIHLARQVYFTFLNLENIQANLGSMLSSIEVAGNTLHKQAASLIKTFTPQPDPVKELKCEIFKFTMQTALEIGMSTATLGMSFGGDVAKQAVPDPAKVGKFSKIAGKIGMGMQLVEYFHGIGQKGADFAGLFPSGFGANDRGDHKLTLTQSTAKGICGAMFGVASGEDTAARTDELRNYIHEFVSETKQQTAQLFDWILNGNEDDPENLILREVMTIESWNLNDRSAELSYSEYEKQLTDPIRKRLISELLAASRCYEKCDQRKDAAAICKKKKENPRFWCPPNTEDVVCEANCYSKINTLNRKTDDIPGQIAFPAYNISMAALHEGSWEHYQTYGRRSYSGVSLLSGLTTQVRASHEFLHLPVCYSEHKTIGNKWRFPAACGKKWNSEDSTAFVKDINVNLTIERNIAVQRIPHVIHDMSPVASYVLLCRLNMMWPLKLKGKAPRLYSGFTDPACDAVITETALMDENEANVHFCTSDVAAKSLHKEMNSITIKLLKSHRKRCKHWRRRTANKAFVNEHKIAVTEKADLAKEGKKKCKQLKEDGKEVKDCEAYAWESR